MDNVPFLNSDGSSGMDMDDEIVQELEEDILIVYTMMMASCNTHHLSNANELEEGGWTTVNHNEGVTDILRCMREVFHVEINCEVHMFDEFIFLVYPSICANAYSTCVERVMGGKPM